MTYIPPRTKKAQRLSLILVIGGIAAAGLAKLLPVGTGFVQLACVIPIVSGIQYLVKYVLSEYHYTIEDKDDGTSDFIITKIQGKRPAKVCHVSLGTVREIFKKGEQHPRTDNRYSYVQNPDADAYVMIFADGEKTVEVIFEPDEAFADALRSRIGNGDEMHFIM